MSSSFVPLAISAQYSVNRQTTRQAPVIKPTEKLPEDQDQRLHDDFIKHLDTFAHTQLFSIVFLALRKDNVEDSPRASPWSDLLELSHRKCFALSLFH
ncbi:hypothetical protein Hypma_007395 [Hypsizygus marmoreus]|uniref:Uncharacterized protein n=1 Tax=Hypsizygus marmoreus TaxID=39966 RepID=A0A369JZB7_HYPMA|nr:hypothetical protein Hypma_007395 [Hypsizygus marmoreus]